MITIVDREGNRMTLQKLIRLEASRSSPMLNGRAKELSSKGHEARRQKNPRSQVKANQKWRNKKHART